MPIFQRAAVRFNQAFGEPNRDYADLFVEGNTFADAMREVGVSDAEHEFISSIPEGIAESIRAVIRSNLTRDVPLSISLIWAPAYDFGVEIWEAPGTKVSPGGISILLRTRYPLDGHPSER